MTLALRAPKGYGDIGPGILRGCTSNLHTSIWGNRACDDITALSLIHEQAFGRAYGTGRSQAHSPCLQHWPSACWGRCPQTPFFHMCNSLLSSSIKVYTFYMVQYLWYSAYGIYNTTIYNIYSTLSRSTSLYTIFWLLATLSFLFHIALILATEVTLDTAT